MGVVNRFDLAQQKRAMSGAISHAATGISKEVADQVADVAWKDLSTNCPVLKSKPKLLSNGSMGKGKGKARAVETQRKGKEQTVTKDLAKDPCSRPKIDRTEGSALLKVPKSNVTTAAPSEDSSVASVEVEKCRLGDFTK